MKALHASLFLLLLAVTGGLKAQNLVLNPSFETEVTCPGVSLLNSFQNWRDPWVNLIGDTCSTSDSYRVGGGFICGGFMPLGNTAARTGTRIAGIITYSGFAFSGCTPAFTDNWREYAEGQLSSPLVAGQTYCVSIWVKLADNVKWSTNKMGVRMSTGLISYSCNTTGADSHLESKGIIPQMESNTVITDITNWTNLTWNYVATGGEQFITIGNFRNTAATTRGSNNCASINTYAYYYLDDISVTPGTCGVLPVALESFDAQCLDGAVKVDWETDAEATEFEVERSYDAKTWEAVGTVDAATIAGKSVSYFFVDHNPFRGQESRDVAYYRLRQRDENGGFAESPLVKVNACEDAFDFVIYPNPSGGQFHVSGEERISGYRVVDLLGATVAEKTGLDAASVSIDLSNYPPGSYGLTIQSKTGVENRRLIKR